MRCAATTTIRGALPAGHIRCTCSEGEWTYNDEALAALASLEQLVEAAQAAVERAERLQLIGFAPLAAALAAVGPGEEAAQ